MALAPRRKALAANYAKRRSELRVLLRQSAFAIKKIQYGEGPQQSLRVYYVEPDRAGTIRLALKALQKMVRDAAEDERKGLDALKRQPQILTKPVEMTIRRSRAWGKTERITRAKARKLLEAAGKATEGLGDATHFSLRYLTGYAYRLHAILVKQGKRTTRTLAVPHELAVICSKDQTIPVRLTPNSESTEQRGRPRLRFVAKVGARRLYAPNK
jgi:hypothetical protein